jgi:hypothetical protein
MGATDVLLLSVQETRSWSENFSKPKRLETGVSIRLSDSQNLLQSRSCTCLLAAYCSGR